MSNDSLFGSDEEAEDQQNERVHHRDVFPSAYDQLHEQVPATTSIESDVEETVASIKQPDIKGFYLIRDLIPLEMQEVLLRRILDEKAVTSRHPQAMLFPRSSESASDIENCPTYLADMVAQLPQLLQAHLSPEDFDIAFNEKQPLQTILNLYAPGQGITPHVDLPHRYAHPIIGISLCNATVMDFLPLNGSQSQAVLLKPGDVYVLLHDARYQYRHGIAYREVDIWRDEEGHVRKLYRGTRISITFRRMLSVTSELSVDA